MNPPTHWLRRVQPGDMQELTELAHSDQHEVIAPTHVCLKEGRLVGYASLGAVALVLPWFHTAKCTARDSLYFINQGENVMANAFAGGGTGLICVPVVTRSPFQPHMERLGYLPVDQATVCFKKVS
jgi:hypothetical protein